MLHIDHGSSSLAINWREIDPDKWQEIRFVQALYVPMAQHKVRTQGLRIPMLESAEKPTREGAVHPSEVQNEQGTADPNFIGPDSKLDSIPEENEEDESNESQKN